MPRSCLILSLLAIVVTTTVGCERKEPPGAAIAPSTGTARAASASASREALVIPPEKASPPSSASAATSAAPSASGSAGPVASAAVSVDMKNEAKPQRTSADLDAKGKALLEAIVSDDPEKARDFFFPREPFTPLKASKDPDRYWKFLYRAYEHDIHKLHRRRRDWTGVTFESMEPGTPPVWVPPGDEANHIGYFRSWGTKLRYRIDGQLYTVKIHTVITWQGRWYITHLLPWKKK